MVLFTEGRVDFSTSVHPGSPSPVFAIPVADGDDLELPDSFLVTDLAGLCL